MIVFLSNWNRKICKFLTDGLMEKGLQVDIVVTPEKYNRSVNWLIGAYRAVKKVDSGDTIICWFDFQGVLCWLLSKLCFKKIYVLSINIRLKDKDTYANRVAETLYRLALRSDRFLGTVNSEEYGQYIAKRLKIDKKLPLVRDVYQASVSPRPFTNNGRRVFCGGSNSRDWDKVLRIAAMMSDYQFILVMPGRLKRAYQDKRTDNVKIFFDQPFQRFLHIMEGATFVLLPVDTNAPAGLIVMFQAATLGRLVVTNSTMVTREYVGKGNGIVMGEGCTDEDYASALRYYSEHESEAAEKVRHFQTYLQEKCSTDIFVNSISEILSNDFAR